MVVKRDVLAFSGEVLLYSGNTLKENDIKSFKSWGVVDVVIDDTEATEASLADIQQTPEIDPELMAEVQEQTRELFRFSNTDHPFVVELMRLNTLNKIKQRPGMEGLNVY
jgi:hypothetical protein